MLRGNPQADGRPVIKDVESEPLEANDVGEAVNYPREIIKRVVELITGRQVRLTKTRQVRRDEVVAIGKQRDQIAEHMASARKAMQQQHRRSFRPPGLAIGNLEAIHSSGEIVGRGHESARCSLSAHADLTSRHARTGAGVQKGCTTVCTPFAQTDILLVLLMTPSAGIN